MKDREDTPAEARVRAMLKRAYDDWPIPEDRAELEKTMDDAVLKIARFNEAMAPFEDDFVRNVQRLREIGYGRMIQLILGEWEKVQPGIAKHWGKQA